MTALSHTERQRLAKLLGSDHASERDAAGLAAHRFIREAGLTWLDVFDVAPELTANRTMQWRDAVVDCLRQPSALRPWEANFLRSLTGFACISSKQRSVLDQITDRVLRRAAA